MKNRICILVALLSVLLSFEVVNAQKTFDKNGRIARDFNRRRKVIGDDTYFQVFDRELTKEQRQAMQFLYAYMPLPDIADYSGDFHLNNVQSVVQKCAWFAG